MAALTASEGLARLDAGDAGASVEWAWAGMPAPGETVSGDRALVVAGEGHVTLAVLDALGHGVEAGAVANGAETVLADAAQAQPAPVTALMRRCDQALTGTRGAVAAIATMSAGGRLEWTAVGNVEALLLRRRGGRLEIETSVPAGAGILGEHRARPPHGALDMEPGDVVVMATDGVSPDFVAGLGSTGEPAALVARILEYVTGHDDSLALVARWSSD